MILLCYVTVGTNLTFFPCNMFDKLSSNTSTIISNQPRLYLYLYIVLIIICMDLFKNFIQPTNDSLYRGIERFVYFDRLHNKIIQ